MFINNRFKAIWGMYETFQQSPKLLIAYINDFPNQIYGKISYFCYFDSAENQLLLIISNLHLKALTLKSNFKCDPNLLGCYECLWIHPACCWSIHLWDACVSLTQAVHELSSPDTVQVTDLPYTGMPGWTKLSKAPATHQEMSQCPVFAFKY